MILSADSSFGRIVVRICGERGLACVALSRRTRDRADPASVAAALDRHRPWAVVDAAGDEEVDLAERDHPDGQVMLATACAVRGIDLLLFSTDCVFHGTKGPPYVERDPVCPLGRSGQPGATDEARPLAAHPTTLIARSGPLFGLEPSRDPLHAALLRLAAGDRAVAPDRPILSPTYAPDLVHAALDLLIDGERGVWHLATPGETSWLNLVCQAAARVGLDPDRVIAQGAANSGISSTGTANRALASERGWPMPPLTNALGRYLAERLAVLSGLNSDPPPHTAQAEPPASLDQALATVGTVPRVS